MKRECPAIPAGRVALLPDETLVVVHRSEPQNGLSSPGAGASESDDTATFCDTQASLRDQPWNAFRTNPLGFSFHVALVALNGYTSYISHSTWYAVATLRLAGFLLIAAIWRKRGLLVGVPGILLGPAYFLGAAFVMSDPARIVSWVRNKTRRGGPHGKQVAEERVPG